jgi:hypothetical protein
MSSVPLQKDEAEGSIEHRPARRTFMEKKALPRTCTSDTSPIRPCDFYSRLPALACSQNTARCGLRIVRCEALLAATC